MVTRREKIAPNSQKEKSFCRCFLFAVSVSVLALGGSGGATLCRPRNHATNDGKSRQVSNLIYLPS